MTLLNDHDAAKSTEFSPKPASGTCQWILSHQLFISWLEKDSNALLWLTGHPGSGKTTLSYFLAQNLNDVRAQPGNVLIYLCQNKNKQTDGREVLDTPVDRSTSFNDSIRSLGLREAGRKHGSVISFALAYISQDGNRSQSWTRLHHHRCTR